MYIVLYLQQNLEDVPVKLIKIGKHQPLPMLSSVSLPDHKGYLDSSAAWQCHQATFSWKISAPKCTLSYIGAAETGRRGWWSLDGPRDDEDLGGFFRAFQKTKKVTVGKDWNFENVF